MIFELHTNEGSRFVRTSRERLIAEMWRYIRAKRAEGRKLAEITFCFRPVSITSY